ncbi:hypothetical protein Tco_1489898 [Tanacetum coccineum]
MGDEHLDTIPETESDDLIKYSVENLVPIPSEFKGISDNTCDVPFCDNSPPLDALKDHVEIFTDSNKDYTSSDDDYGEDIDYVEASPPDSELVSLEEVNDVYQEKEEIDLEDILQIQEIIKHQSSYYNSLPEFKSFSDHTKETSSGSTTTHVDNSLPEEPRVHMPNVLPTHPTLMMDSDFIPSNDSLGSDLEVSFPSRTRNKIFDPRIFFEVQSKIFLF